MMLVGRTTIDIDSEAFEAAREALGTAGLSTTVNAALREIARRAQLADFDVRRDIDGSPAEVDAGRERRGAERSQ
jgi:Arc/MetJ family transcription regulator